MNEINKISLKTLVWISALEGALVVLFILLSPSKEDGFFLGYSLIRLAMTAATLGLALLCTGLAIWMGRNPDNENAVANRLIDVHEIFFHLSLLAIILFIGLCGIALTGYWLQLGNIGSYIQRGLPLLLWLVLFIVQIEIWLLQKGKYKERGFDELIFIILIYSLGVFIFIDIIWRGPGINFTELKIFSQIKIIPNLWWLFLLLLMGWSLRKREKLLPAQMIFIFIVMWFLLQFTSFIGRWYFRAPEQAYFPYLADSFLHGRLYLENPISLVELTPKDGHWYLPYPPLAAILMMPLVALWGPANVNSSNFSIFFASVAVSLVFAVLEMIRRREWIKLNTVSNLWLTALFALSTPFWQISISGEVWYINQVMTLAFVAGAILLTLLDAPPLLAGLLLGLAILARPPIVLIGLLLFAMYWQIHQNEHGRVKFSDWFKWGVLAVIPVAVIGSGFLLYNQARFGSLFDFGYVNMNIGEPARTDVRTYGQFNVRYFARNIKLMFFSFPYWDNECSFFTTKIDGMSMFAATPALIYIFGSFKKKIWALGAWITSILLLIPLMLYFTTGIFQFGYRYVLDLFIPLLMLIASAMPREKLSWHTRLLILFGILINYWGVWWFYRHWCR